MRRSSDGADHKSESKTSLSDPMTKRSNLEVGTMLERQTTPHTVVGPTVGDPGHEAEAPRPSPIVGPSPLDTVPDPDAEPKRKRTASQKFQRLPRSISNETRRTGSALAIPVQGIPDLKREDTPTSISEDEPVTDAPAAGSPSPSLNEVAKAKKLKKDKEKRQETPVPVPVVPPELPASHHPEPESRITEPPPNLADPQVHGSTLSLVEQAPGKLSDDLTPPPTTAETPDMLGSDGAAPHGFETECVISWPALPPILIPTFSETRSILPGLSRVDASASTESASNGQAVSSDVLGSQPELSPLPTLPQSHANLFPREVLDEVLDLTDQVASIALFGPIGVGKSSVALTLLHHNRTKAKYGEHRYLMHCDNVMNSLEGFLKGLCDAIHVDHTTGMTQIRSQLESSSPCVVLLDGVDFILDPLAPESEDISAMIEEFGSNDRICLLTTSRMDPHIHGFHRVEVPTLSEDDARNAFYSLCSMDRSPAVDDLIATLDFHPLSIAFLASSVRENDWDEPMLLKAWDDNQADALRKKYHQRLGDAVEPLLRSPTIQDLGTTALDVLGSIAAFPRGIEERRLQSTFADTAGVEVALDVLCRFSLIYHQDGLVKMLSPFQFYFLESMLEPAQHAEVIHCNADNCHAAKACMSLPPSVYGFRVIL